MSPLQNTRMSDKKIKKKNIRQSDLVPLHIVNFTHTTHPLKCSIMNTSLRYRVIYCNNLTSHPCEQSIHGNCPYHRCAWHSKLHWMLPVLVYHSVISCAPGLCRSITTNIILYFCLLIMDMYYSYITCVLHASCLKTTMYSSGIVCSVCSRGFRGAGGKGENMRHWYSCFKHVRHGLVLIPSMGLGTAETAPTYKAMTANQHITDMQSLVRHYGTV